MSICRARSRVDPEGRSGSGMLPRLAIVPRQGRNPRPRATRTWLRGPRPRPLVPASPVHGHVSAYAIAAITKRDGKTAGAPHTGNRHTTHEGHRPGRTHRRTPGPHTDTKTPDSRTRSSSENPDTRKGTRVRDSSPSTQLPSHRACAWVVVAAAAKLPTSANVKTPRIMMRPLRMAILPRAGGNEGTFPKFLGR